MRDRHESPVDPIAGASPGPGPEPGSRIPAIPSPGGCFELPKIRDV